jgi:hypothetical protein
MDLPLIIGALIVAALLFLALINIIKTAIKTALLIAVIIFALQLISGVGPEEVWTQVAKIIGTAWQWLQNLIFNNKSDPAIESQAMIWLLRYLG